MYKNKCTKCGVEFETKNPKRVICPGCLYPDKKDLSLESYNKVLTQPTEPEKPPVREDDNFKQKSPGYYVVRDTQGPEGQQGQPNNQGGYQGRPNYNDRGQNYQQDRGQGYAPRPQSSGGYNNNRDGNYNRGGGNFNPGGGNYNNNRNFNPGGGNYNSGGGNYNSGGGNYNSGGGNYNPGGGNYNNGGGGGFRRPMPPRPSGGAPGGAPGGFRRPFQSDGPRRPFQGDNRGPRRPAVSDKKLLISREQVVEIENNYRQMLPLPNPDCHEVIAEKIGIEANKVFFGINLVRQKMNLPKLPYPKRKLAISIDQLNAIKSLYTPLLPLPPIGCHKFLAKQLKMDEWRVHVGIGIIRKQMSLPRWNTERDDAPAEFKNQPQKTEKVEKAEKIDDEEKIEKVEKKKTKAKEKAVDKEKEI